MTFEEYCFKKKISVDNFKASDPGLFHELTTYFIQVHPESFTQQKKFLINPLRRLYPMSNKIDKSLD